MAIVIRKKIPNCPEVDIPSDSTHGNTIWAMLTQCWAFDSDGRPSAAKVRDMVGILA